LLGGLSVVRDSAVERGGVKGTRREARIRSVSGTAAALTPQQTVL
jgi:hypothetical protein